LTPEDVVTEPVDVWPENIPALDLFSMLGTQWRIGMGGPTGLDYNILFHEMDRMSLPREEYDSLLMDVRVMEEEALSIMCRKD